MNARESLRELIERVANNLFVRIILGLVSGITAYLEFRNAGWTLLFWVLAGLTLIAALFIAVPLIRQWLQELQRRWIKRAKLYYDQQSRIEMLAALIEEFETIEKAKALAEAVRDKTIIHILAIPPFEKNIGVLLNVGQREDVKVGTRLLIYRTDEYAPSGQRIEQPIAIVKVTYIQAGNNCSQAIVSDRLDSEFWEQTAVRLQKEKRLDPPGNFATPHIPAELGNLSINNIATIRQYLETIYGLLIGKADDHITSEEVVK